jgi:hypothetical protein
MKIFNAQRFRLLRGRRLQKYIVYAFGEIVLVIIGILMALGINNWNQNRQLSNANKEIQKKVLAQIDKDIKALEAFQNELDVLQQTYMKALGREYDRSKVDTGGLIATILFDVNTLSLDQHVINLIETAQLDESPASTELVELNSTYKLYAKDIKDIEIIIYEKMTNNLAEIEKTQPWYIDLITDFICRNDCINYLLKDEGHKSRVASLRFLYINSYGSILKEFHKDLVSAKESLQKTMTDEG